MADDFTCDHCSKKTDIRKRRSGVVRIARVKDRKLIDLIEDFLSKIKVTEYEVRKNEVTMNICEPCIDAEKRRYDWTMFLAFGGGLFLLLIQFYTGFKWYLLASGGIILSVAIQVRSREGRHWKDVADRLAAKVMRKKLEKQMEKDPSLKILTREEYSELIER